jgi:hypothetical protein
VHHFRHQSKKTYDQHAKKKLLGVGSSINYVELVENAIVVDFSQTRHGKNRLTCPE